MSKLKVLVASSEVAPFAKTGGLADVAGSLPIALEEMGAEVRVIMPKYGCVKAKGAETTIGEDVKVWFVENDDYFNRKELYGDKFGDYADNLDRFSFFSREALAWQEQGKAQLQKQQRQTSVDERAALIQELIVAEEGRRARA